MLMSVPLSVCLSVALRYRGHVGWVTSKLVTRIINLGSSLLASPNIANSPPSKFEWNRGGVAIFNRKTAISLKRGKVGQRLLLITNRKLHTRFRSVPKSTTLDDFAQSLRTLFQNTRTFEGHLEN